MEKKTLAVSTIITLIAISVVGFALSNQISAISGKIDSLSNNQVFSDTLDQMKQSVVYIQSGDLGGTGFVIRDDGYILTAGHTISNPEQIEVIMLNTSVLSGVLIEKNINNRDLAIIKVSSKLIPVKLPNRIPPIRAGERIGLIGYSFGRPQQNVIEGIVSFYGIENDIAKIRFSSLIHSGDSGGPLFLSSTGEIIGVFTSGIGATISKLDASITNEIPDSNTRLLAQLIVNSHNGLANAIERTSQTGIGEGVPIDNSILDSLPPKT